MFDGRFDQHFAEIFATSLANDKPGPQAGWSITTLFAATLGIIALFSMAVIR